MTIKDTGKKAISFSPLLPSDQNIVLSRYYDKALEIQNRWKSDKGVRFTRVLKKVLIDEGFNKPSEKVSQLADYLSSKGYCNPLKCEYDIVSCFDWEDGDFGDADSCFWGDRWEALKVLEEAGAKALRLHFEDRSLNCRMFFKEFDGFVVAFNPYGRYLSSLPLVLGEIIGKTPRKIELCNDGYNDGLIYINGSKGFVYGNFEYDAFDLGIDCSDTEYYQGLKSTF